MSSAAPIRVLLVDDSRTARALMRQLCEDDPRLEVVGEAADGRRAVELVASLRPSIVVMDIEMPVMTGIEATQQIMAQTPTPILIVTAHYDAQDVALSLRAVQAGALSLLHKPGGPGSPRYRQDAQRFVQLVKALAGVRTVRRQLNRTTAGAARARTEPVQLAGPVRAIGVAASTGGPAALYRLLTLLPPRLGVPVLVVQHIVDGFAPGLAVWLRTATALPVRLAEDGERLLPDTVYVAPDGQHLQVSQLGSVALTKQPPISGFRPSATALFTSMAQVYGGAAVGVVLTGMGSDGLEGARALRQAGAPVLTQDADSSVVFGMPRAVAEAGLATSVGTVEQIAETLARLAPTQG